MGNCCVSFAANLGCDYSEKGEKGVCKVKENENRSCTDIPCFLLFLAFWAVVLILMGTALSRGGSLSRAVYGLDYNGVPCGEGANAGMNYIAFPYLSKAPQAKICVADCNATQTDPRMARFNTYKSTAYLKFCLPDAGVAAANLSVQNSPEFQDFSSAARRAMSDLNTGYGVLAIGAALAFVFALIYLQVVQCAATLLVWLSLLAILLGGAFVAATCLKYADDATVTQNDPYKRQALLAIGIIFAVCTFLYFCAIVFMRDRIRLAIKITQEASKALADMPMAALFPILPFLITIAYFVWWCYTAIVIFAAGDPSVVKNPDWTVLTPMPTGWPAFNASGVIGYKVQDFDTNLQRAFCIHFFHLLWNVQFWVFFTFTVICGAVAQWYFTPYVNDQKPRGDAEGQLPDRPIVASLWRTIRYHLGTVCFAALVIAIIQAVRAFVLYLEEKYRKANGGELNCVMKCVFCCINCCLACIQKCVEQINRNGLVFVAVYGSPFCASTCNALGAAGSNLGRVAWVSMVGDFLIGIGKVFTALLSTGICGMILFSSEYKDKISTPAFLLVVCFIINWCIASLFMVVYETCIDTIFMCFLIDEDNNKGTGNYLAHKDLLAVIGEGEAEAKAKDGPAPAEAEAKPSAQ